MAEDIYIAQITRDDNALREENYHLGSISVGVTSFNYTFILKNDSVANMTNASIYLYLADNYEGNGTKSEDLNEILTVWPTLTSKDGDTCGVYLFRYPYDAVTNPTSNFNNWIHFSKRGNIGNPILLPKQCIQNGTTDGLITPGGQAQLALRFVIPNANALASVKCCRCNVVYQT